MEKLKQSEYLPIFLLIGIFILCIPFFWLHQGLLTIDTGRELYIPSRMLSGELLYKDILNIYGAFAYQLNAVLFGIFGERLETLYSFGLVNSLIIVLSVFFISREFFDKTVSFLFALLTIAIPVFTPYLFNTNLPYSYCFAYSLSAFLLSLLFLIKFEKTKEIKFSLFSSFFIGISIASKLEFSLFILVIAFILIQNKLTIKQLGINFLSFLLIPVISYGILLIQGVKISDFILTLGLIKSLCASDSFRIFYQSGLTLKSFIIRIFSAFALSLAFLVLFLRNKIKQEKKWISILLNTVCVLILSGIFLLFWKFIYASLPVLILILTIIFFKKTDKSALILLSAIILGSFKLMFYLNIEQFGSFLLPLYALGIAVFMKEKRSLIIIALTSLILVFGFDDCYWRQEKTFYLETPKGNFYTFKKEGLPIHKLIMFAKENLKKEDRMLILPEGAFVNFALSQPSSSKLYSLIPLYVSMIGEDKITEELKKDNPKYIVITSLDTIEFGASTFCRDYALEVCKYIDNNYTYTASIDETSYKMNIYERKE